jgi:CheY-like chemotaxis protein
MDKTSRSILIIDDDPFFQKVLADNFRESGFTVFIAKDGIEGREVYCDTLPDAVISDLVMPRMGGVSTCMEIGRLAGGSPAPPVIVLLTSMFQEPAHEHSAPEMGARIHIPKSTPPVDIVIIVEQLLERGKYLQN